MERGRIDHTIPIEFEHLLKRHTGYRVVFEVTMKWHWLYEVLETHIEHKDLVLANACKRASSPKSLISVRLPTQ